MIHRVQCFASLSVIDTRREVVDDWWQVLQPGGRFSIADVRHPDPGAYARFAELIASAARLREGAAGRLCPPARSGRQKLM